MRRGLPTLSKSMANVAREPPPPCSQREWSGAQLAMGDLLSTHISIVRGMAPVGIAAGGITTYWLFVRSNESAVPAPGHGASGATSLVLDASNTSTDASIVDPPCPAAPAVPPADASTPEPAAPPVPPTPTGPPLPPAPGPALLVDGPAPPAPGPAPPVAGPAPPLPAKPPT